MIEDLNIQYKEDNPTKEQFAAALPDNQKYTAEEWNALINKINEVIGGVNDAPKVLGMPITMADSPIEKGLYIPTEKGTYTNAGGLKYLGEEKGAVIFVKDTSWSKVVIPINIVQPPYPIIKGYLGNGNFHEEGTYNKILEGDKKLLYYDVNDKIFYYYKERIGYVPFGSGSSDSPTFYIGPTWKELPSAPEAGDIFELTENDPDIPSNVINAGDNPAGKYKYNGSVWYRVSGAVVEEEIIALLNGKANVRLDNLASNLNVSEKNRIKEKLSFEDTIVPGYFRNGQFVNENGDEIVEGDAKLLYYDISREALYYKASDDYYQLSIGGIGIWEKMEGNPIKLKSYINPGVYYATNVTGLELPEIPEFDNTKPTFLKLEVIKQDDETVMQELTIYSSGSKPIIAFREGSKVYATSYLFSEFTILSGQSNVKYITELPQPDVDGVVEEQNTVFFLKDEDDEIKGVYLTDENGTLREVDYEKRLRTNWETNTITTTKLDKEAIDNYGDSEGKYNIILTLPNNKLKQTRGYYNIIMGDYREDNSNEPNVSESMFIGHYIPIENTSFGNVALGTRAGFWSRRNGKTSWFNTIVGNDAGFGRNWARGMNNVIIGYSAPFLPRNMAHYSNGGLTNNNKLIIGSNAHKKVKIKNPGYTEGGSEPEFLPMTGDNALSGGYEIDDLIVYKENTYNHDPLIFGDFKDKWVSIIGDFILETETNPEVEPENFDGKRLAVVDDIGKVKPVKSTDYIVNQIKAMTPEQVAEIESKLSIEGGTSSGVVTSQETTIHFKNEADFGTNANPLNEITFDFENAKRDVIQCVYFNGQELPTGVSWLNGSNNLFQPNVTYYLVLKWDGETKVLGNLNTI